MPIISNIGRRSSKIRIVFALMFTLLILGSATMVYPFLLMFSGSFKSEVDCQGLSVIPQYWYDNDLLYKKYVEARYCRTEVATASLQRPYGSWRQATRVKDLNPAWTAAWRSYRDEADWPTPWFKVAQHEGIRFYRRNGRAFRRGLSDRFDGSIEALNEFYGTGFVNWESVNLPETQLHTRRVRNGVAWSKKDFESTFVAFKNNLRKMDRVPLNIDGFYWSTFLRTKYAKINDYNRTHGTQYTDYRLVQLDRRAPAEGLMREDWETFVREELNLNFIRVDPSKTADFREFLNHPDRYPDIEEYNKTHSADYDRFEEIPFPDSTPTTARSQQDLSEFLQDREACDLASIEVYGPRQDFLEYLKRTGQMKEGWEALPLPLAEADYLDMEAQEFAFRWEEVKRNYVHVIDYILRHGHAAINTVIYCSLLIVATLIVNPLAAYALSRYKPPSQYKIILICMATMAFPAEVTMIPAFLLLKKFPLWNLVAGFGIAAAVLTAGFKLYPKASEKLIAFTALAAGILGGWWLAPMVATLFGHEKTHTSLLNTFAALILPAMANGYGLFLLKGFFDSLPRELYESADIDGASEWTKFWSFTMALSKPILAVLALGAFTGAYSEFMMALIIIPDRDMWTLMVWIFQLQIGAPQPVIQASVLIAAIPTFVVFIFCQNIIIRGIVVPVEK